MIGLGFAGWGFEPSFLYMDRGWYFRQKAYDLELPDICPSVIVSIRLKLTGFSIYYGDTRSFRVQLLGSSSVKLRFLKLRIWCVDSPKDDARLLCGWKAKTKLLM